MDPRSWTPYLPNELWSMVIALLDPLQNWTHLRLTNKFFKQLVEDDFMRRFSTAMMEMKLSVRYKPIYMGRLADSVRFWPTLTFTFGEFTGKGTVVYRSELDNILEDGRENPHKVSERHMQSIAECLPQANHAWNMCKAHRRGPIGEARAGWQLRPRSYLNDWTSIQLTERKVPLLGLEVDVGRREIWWEWMPVYAAYLWWEKKKEEIHADPEARRLAFS
ncbi:hypothetical protein BU23DRAFT_203890 [Bimuria novae-zelandiae CBS 107.79]|uniref:F-box domain-containing protein n=1 Tax=Bimuria novae-zelandiae CBS 107.79 TaxID=1447943 RepID=A0A6A5V0S8_9PLEO|nr:hypothetical protein BU23DRAFT_203890 [Bimuria novae-zelandiae CBS 107.79]